jgi:hypothetical protein
MPIRSTTIWNAYSASILSILLTFPLAPALAHLALIPPPSHSRPALALHTAVHRARLPTKKRVPPKEHPLLRRLDQALR